MAINVRNAANAILPNLVAQFNKFKRVYTESETTYPHADITSVTSGAQSALVSTPAIMSSATASDLPTVIVRANEAKAVMNVHLVDALAHKAADTVIATADATDQATANTLLNAIKAKLNTHDASTAAHFTADATNTVSSPDATNLGTSITLANELFTDINAHIQFAIDVDTLNIVAP